MNITILSLFPALIEEYCSTSIAARACTKQLVDFSIINIRDYATDVHKSCDDTPYGGGAGMVLMPAPISRALEDVKNGSSRTIFATPGGVPFTHQKAVELSQEANLVFICGHYEGLDQRIIDLYVDDELSIGDYVVSSGEMASLIIVDAVIRLVKGVINEDSLVEESFSQGLLEYPHYTRPATFQNLSVPEILLSGNHEAIDLWRKKQSLTRTQRNRPDLFDTYMLDLTEQK